MKVLKPVGELIGTVSQVIGESFQVVLKVSDTAGTMAEAANTAAKSVDNLFKAGEQMSMGVYDDAVSERVIDKVKGIGRAYVSASETAEELKSNGVPESKIKSIMATMETELGIA